MKTKLIYSISITLSFFGCRNDFSYSFWRFYRKNYLYFYFTKRLNRILFTEDDD